MGNYLLSLRDPPPSSGAAVAEDDECNHPLHYDWTLPKWSPFRSDPSSSSSNNNNNNNNCQGSNLKEGEDPKQQQHSSKTQEMKSRNEGNKTGPLTQSQLHPVATKAVAAKSSPPMSSWIPRGVIKTAAKSAKEAIGKSLNATLTSTIDVNDTKPANGTKAKLHKEHNAGGVKSKTSSSSGSVGSVDGGAKSTTAPGRQLHNESKPSGAPLKKSPASSKLPSGSIKKVDSMRPQTIGPAPSASLADQGSPKAATNIHTAAGTKRSS